jgi:3-(3-hydroxy-phenyl)propionate hydroxylase
MGSSLMNSYQSERREHAWSLIQMAIQIGWVMVPRNWFHTYGQIAFFKATRIIPKLRDYFLSMKFKPEPRFLVGFLVDDKKNGRRTLVGRMLPQPMVTSGSDEPVLLDNILGTGFSLLALGIESDIAFKDCSHPIWEHLKVNRIALLKDAAVRTSEPSITNAQLQDHVWPAKLERYLGHILLIRPDRYVAAAFTPESATEMAATIQALVDKKS